MNSIDYKKILTFWFGEINDELAPPHKQKVWYQASAQTDEMIRREYGPVLEQADGGQLDHWAEQPRGRLALILLFDQFSRNIYRGTSHAFAYDTKGLALCRQGIELQHDSQLTLVERLFFYHPLEHAEDLQAQQQSVGLFSALMSEYPEGAKHETASKACTFAIEHRDIIQQFGRFPHRNQVLGRSPTPEEQAYLQDGGKRFGQ